VWFKFVAIAESAQIDTCASALEGDTIVNVFSDGDPSGGSPPCASLSLIGCGDIGGCPTDYLGEKSPHTRFCVEGLTVGQTYYIEMASKMQGQQGMYEIQVKMPCQYLTPFSPHDCNENGVVDGCDLAERTSRDCNLDRVLDECAGDSEDSPDCDGDGFANTCDPFRARVVSESPTLTFGHAVAFDEGVLLVGDPGAKDGGGVVYVFERHEEDWVSSVVLSNPDPPALTSFGMALAGDGHRLLVIAKDSETGDFVRGSVLAFRREQSGWMSEDFPNFVSNAGDVREVIGAVMEGDLAAVWTSCAGEPKNCERDLVVHVFRRIDQEWRLDGVIPREGGFERSGFAIDFGGGSLAVVSQGWLTIYEQEQAGWTEGFRQGVGLGDPTVSFDGTLIAIGGWVPDWWSLARYSALSLFRRRYGVWEGGSWLSTEHEFEGYPAIVSILTPITLAITVATPHECPAVLVYQRTDHPCDWCGYWEPLATLPLTHCGPEPRTLALDRSPSGLAVGLSGVGFSGLPTPPGSVQVFAFPETDCNAKLGLDSCEIQVDMLDDCNHDQAPDVCQPRGEFDYDLDLSTTLRDMAGLQNCFTGASGAALGRCCGVFDFESFDNTAKDGDADWEDLVAFVGAMTGP